VSSELDCKSICKILSCQTFLNFIEQFERCIRSPPVMDDGSEFVVIRQPESMGLCDCVDVFAWVNGLLGKQ